jgi:hypothetical protein
MQLEDVRLSHFFMLLLPILTLWFVWAYKRKKPWLKCAACLFLFLYVDSVTDPQLLDQYNRALSHGKGKEWKETALVFFAFIRVIVILVLLKLFYWTNWKREKMFLNSPKD